MLLNKYDITETKYNELKKIDNKTLIEIEKQNMENTYYRNVVGIFLLFYFKISLKTILKNSNVILLICNLK